MKKGLLGLLLAFLLVGMAQASTVGVTFTYNFTGLAICSGTVTTNCIDHFEAGTLSGGTFTSSVSVPVPAGASGTVTGIAGSFTLNSFGQQVIAVVAVAKNGSGARVTSDPALCQATATIVPSPPTALQVTIS